MEWQARNPPLKKGSHEKGFRRRLSSCAYDGTKYGTLANDLAKRIGLSDPGITITLGRST